MSTRDDARLTARERAAFASLEAAAAADDPQLAAHLKGSTRVWLRASLPPIKAGLDRAWSAVVSNGWLGAPVVVVGLVLVVWSISTTLVIGVIGAALTTVGLRMLAGAFQDWATNRRLDLEET